MIKRCFDFVLSLFGLVVISPVMLVTMYLVWRQDRRSPFYMALRAGRSGIPFKMFKLRSMIVDADKTGVSSTSSNDSRITTIGRFIRKVKLDEISQLMNVLIGDMSFVGPRPNLVGEIARYTEPEKKLLSVKPGITDISSIVFSDEGEILKDSKDPDLDYERLIRPWKSRLGILYIEHQSLLLDLKLILLTAVAIVSKANALKGINKILIGLNADPQLIEVCLRRKALFPFPPPGAAAPVETRLSCKQ